MLQAYLQAAYTHKLVRSTLEDAMVAESSLRRFHPVRDWLATLVWDGTQRIDKWLSYAFGCEDNSYHRAIGSKLLIAAVRRVRQPGVKFDHLPVFEGLQGIGKSRSVRALFGAHWFSDAMPNDLASRESPMALQGRWCMEFSEIDALIRTEIETVKAFLSRQVDRYRPMYGRTYVERPRQCVLIGTTNSRDYLRDSTGNRRIWPVYCTVAAPAWLEENRDQIWAEAAHRELSGEAIWLDDIEVREGAERAQAERRTEDVWSIAVAEWLIGRTEFATHEILSGPLQIPRERQDRRAQLRVASILREMGWESVIRWDRDKKGAARVWQRDKQADAAGTLL
jgi:putative DNA primase/helicase